MNQLEYRHTDKLIDGNTIL